LKTRLEFLSGSGGSCDCEVGAITSHFYELSVSDFDLLNASVLEAILSDPDLVVHNEESVFELVHRRAPSNLPYLGFCRLFDSHLYRVSKWGD
jgi:hypothetical protein